MWLNNYVEKHALGTIEYIEEVVNDDGKHVWKVTVQSMLSIRLMYLDILITGMFQ